jgi:hypothetical protein
MNFHTLNKCSSKESITPSLNPPPSILEDDVVSATVDELLVESLLLLEVRASVELLLDDDVTPLTSVDVELLLLVEREELLLKELNS